MGPALAIKFIKEINCDSCQEYAKKDGICENCCYGEAIKALSEKDNSISQRIKRMLKKEESHDLD